MAIGIAVAGLLAGWGLFIWFNKHAEEMEPEAMERTKRETNRSVRNELEVTEAKSNGRRATDFLTLGRARVFDS